MRSSTPGPGAPSAVATLASSRFDSFVYALQCSIASTCVSALPLPRSHPLMYVLRRFFHAYVLGLTADITRTLRDTVSRTHACMSSMGLATGAKSRNPASRVQAAPRVACRELGFGSGFSLRFDTIVPVRPPWLSGASCSGAEAALAACELPAFGDTSSCESSERLYCFTGSDSTETSASMCHPASTCHLPHRCLCDLAVNQLGWRGKSCVTVPNIQV